MKKLFTKPFKFPTTKSAAPASVPPPVLAPVPTAHTTTLQPKFIVPPTPHPCPYEYIAIVATKQGLLLRQYLQDGTRPGSQVRIAWGKEGKVEEIPIGDGDDGVDWSDNVIVYGIVGILTLFTGKLDPHSVNCVSERSAC